MEKRLEGSPEWSEIKAVYLDLTTLTGQLQGLVSQRAHGSGTSGSETEAERTLLQLKAILRQVGLDIRLSSGAALTLGLRTGLEMAHQTLDALKAR
ncbi:MAG: hypothetical protein ACRDFX_00470 [Chloroflexota bacterium]